MQDGGHNRVKVCLHGLIGNGCHNILTICVICLIILFSINHNVLNILLLFSILFLVKYKQLIQVLESDPLDQAWEKSSYQIVLNLRGHCVMSLAILLCLGLCQLFLKWLSYSLSCHCYEQLCCSLVSKEVEDQ